MAQKALDLGLKLLFMKITNSWFFSLAFVSWILQSKSVPVTCLETFTAISSCGLYPIKILISISSDAATSGRQELQVHHPPSQIPSVFIQAASRCSRIDLFISLTPSNTLSNAIQGTSVIDLLLKYRCRRRLQCRWTLCLASWRQSHHWVDEEAQLLKYTTEVRDINGIVKKLDEGPDMIMWYHKGLSQGPKIRSWLVASNKKQNTASVDVDCSDTIKEKHFCSSLFCQYFQNILSDQKGQVHEKAKWISACCYSLPSLPTSCCSLSRFILTIWQNASPGEKRLQTGCQLIDLIHSLKDTQILGPGLRRTGHGRKLSEERAAGLAQLTRETPVRAPEPNAASLWFSKDSLSLW